MQPVVSVAPQSRCGNSREEKCGELLGAKIMWRFLPTAKFWSVTAAKLSNCGIWKQANYCIRCKQEFGSLQQQQSARTGNILLSAVLTVRSEFGIFAGNCCTLWRDIRVRFRQWRSGFWAKLSSAVGRMVLLNFGNCGFKRTRQCRFPTPKLSDVTPNL